jgi:hypothetical protein
VDRPAEEKEPENSRENELDDRGKEAALKQLTQAGNEEATNRGEDVSR